MTYEEIKEDFIAQLEQLTLVINKNELDNKLLMDDLLLMPADIYNIVISLEELYDVDTSDIDMEDLLTVKDVIVMFEEAIANKTE
ncbi:MAG: hypothetical protein ABSG25_09240 [Bryobacteraceae bacterium]